MLPVQSTSKLVDFILNKWYCMNIDENLRFELANQSSKNQGLFIGHKKLIVAVMLKDETVYGNGGSIEFTGIQLAIIRKSDEFEAYRAMGFHLGEFKERTKVTLCLNWCKSLILKLSKISDENSSLSDFEKFIKESWKTKTELLSE